MTQVVSLVCHRRPTWLTSCLGLDNVQRQMPASHVTQTTLADDSQPQHQQVLGVTRDVTEDDVTQRWTVTELQPSPSVVGDQLTGNSSCGHSELTAV